MPLSRNNRVIIQQKTFPKTQLIVVPYITRLPFANSILKLLISKTPMPAIADIGILITYGVLLHGRFAHFAVYLCCTITVPILH